ncbi:unnamed protein product, partial [Laminaria digitata]
SCFCSLHFIFWIGLRIPVRQKQCFSHRTTRLTETSSHVTCHLHSSCPSGSSLTAMKSISPWVTPLQFPLDNPAKTTELSSKAAAARNDYFSPLPACRTQ